ncbi:hypothetical protein AAMO2058_000543100 [Amorphochlora amoebiformis]
MAREAHHRWELEKPVSKQERVASRRKVNHLLDQVVSRRDAHTGHTLRRTLRSREVGTYVSAERDVKDVGNGVTIIPVTDCFDRLLKGNLECEMYQLNRSFCLKSSEIHKKVDGLSRDTFCEQPGEKVSKDRIAKVYNIPVSGYVIVREDADYKSTGFYVGEESLAQDESRRKSTKRSNILQVGHPSYHPTSIETDPLSIYKPIFRSGRMHFRPTFQSLGRLEFPELPKGVCKFEARVQVSRGIDVKAKVGSITRTPWKGWHWCPPDSTKNDYIELDLLTNKKVTHVGVMGAQQTIKRLCTVLCHKFANENFCNHQRVVCCKGHRLNDARVIEFKLSVRRDRSRTWINIGIFPGNTTNLSERLIPIAKGHNASIEARYLRLTPRKFCRQKCMRVAAYGFHEHDEKEKSRRLPTDKNSPDSKSDGTFVRYRVEYLLKRRRWVKDDKMSSPPWWYSRTPKGGKGRIKQILDKKFRGDTVYRSADVSKGDGIANKNHMPRDERWF